MPLQFITDCSGQSGEIEQTVQRCVETGLGRLLSDDRNQPGRPLIHTTTQRTIIAAIFITTSVVA